ncbi:MAG: energy transducer TonB [Deltaproteobacteria bacterium]|jgi:protein TonB|nr:energy transducer TonB [Deltaproteobacteria bacterium]
MINYKYKTEAIDPFADLDKKAFLLALTMGFFLHASVIATMFWWPFSFEKERFEELATFDFSTYDPLGGQGGQEGSDSIDEAAPSALAPQPEEPLPVPEPESEPEVEPDVEEEHVSLVESVSPKAEEALPPLIPIKEKIKSEKIKPKPKPKPQINTKPAASSSLSATNLSGAAAGRGPAGSGGPGQGGTAGGMGKGNPNALKAYQAKVRLRLERSKKYPPGAQSKRLTGVTTVTFVISRNGTVTSTRMVKSSGHQILDDEAMSLLRRVSPLPPFPEAMSQASITLTVPLRFSVR